MRRHGMRNSNAWPSPRPRRSPTSRGLTSRSSRSTRDLYVKSNLSGEFTVVNERAGARSGALGLWDAEMRDELKYEDGSVQAIDRIPDDDQGALPDRLRDRPLLADRLRRPPPEVDRHGPVAQPLRRRAPSGKQLNEMYRLAWRAGLKTTYYLRSRGATQAEKSTIDVNRWGIQPRWMQAPAAPRPRSSMRPLRDRPEAEPTSPSLGCEASPVVRQPPGRLADASPLQIVAVDWPKPAPPSVSTPRHIWRRGINMGHSDTSPTLDLQSAPQNAVAPTGQTPDQLRGRRRQPADAAQVRLGLGALPQRLRQPLDADRGADGRRHRPVEGRQL